MLSAYSDRLTQLKLGHYVPIITNRNCCARLLVHFHNISKQNLPPPWVGKFAWYSRPVLCVGSVRQSMKNCPLTTLRKLVFVFTSTHLLSRTLNSQLISREHPYIEILWAVMTGDRIATEGTNNIWTMKFPRKIQVFSNSSQLACKLRWWAEQPTDTLSRSYNISCRWKKRSFGQQILMSEQYLLPEGAELRPANFSWRNSSKTTRPVV